MIESAVRTSFQPSVPSLSFPVTRRDSNSREPEKRTEPASVDQSQNGATQESGPAAVLELSSEEERAVAQLRAQDLEVRQHERAHLAAAGGHATSGASFQYVIGPDGRRYAVGGEVSISLSPESTPEATIQKARAIRRAALAPANPSAQDRAVAAQASRLEAAAQRELNQKRVEGSQPAEEREHSPAPIGNAPARSGTTDGEASQAVGEIIDLIA